MLQPPPPEFAELPDLGLRPRPGRPWLGVLVAVGGLALVLVTAPVLAGLAVARPGPIPRLVWALGVVALPAVLFFML